MSEVAFSDQVTFHLSSQVNTHNSWTWAWHNPKTSVGLEQDSPKLNVFCVLSSQTVYRQFVYVETTIKGVIDLDMLENWLWPQHRTFGRTWYASNKMEGSPLSVGSARVPRWSGWFEWQDQCHTKDGIINSFAKHQLHEAEPLSS